MKVGFVLLTAEDKESACTPSYATIRTMALLAETDGSFWEWALAGTDPTALAHGFLTPALYAFFILFTVNAPKEASMLERSGVLRTYGSFVNQLWEDESILEELQADPHGVLNNYGFDIPEGSKITLIVSELNTEGSPETQANLYAEGAETGEYKFIVPLKPDGVELEDVPLSEDVLELMAGGSMEAGCCPCCCCPCCGSSEQL